MHNKCGIITMRLTSKNAKINFAQRKSNITVNIANDLKQSRSVSKCICPAGLELTKNMCHLGVRQFVIFGRTKSTERISPQTRNIRKFPSKLKFPKSKKNLTAQPGICEKLQKNFPSGPGKLNLFYKLLKAENPNNITSELSETFNSVTKELSSICEFA